ncbi:polysaccharide pyruvyl transferase [Aminobacter aminovorans]|uniref:Polysaccharide pyruvyl transferase n=1 Tax=Aminobacter aminovorans TaxID=83263 RepID=A0A380WRC2_AMIAI|nr:polysaccharide pyruvyl transferase family protein [Aminobacter aminovorans]TCS23543.1 polysaccharide pyruvyl transferase [Aminobacter aminovorans]SUU91509.1 Polysaccharide pyruvyl transferase [Aminobacter aminovorans]
MSLKSRLSSFRRVYLAARTIETPPTLLFWWGSYGFKGGPTIGDLMAVDNLSASLRRRGIEHAVISHPELQIPGHLPVDDIYSIKPVRKVVFVCGPITDSRDLSDLLSIHRHAGKIAAGVSILPNQAKMNRRFDQIVGRDGIDPSYFDLAVSETVEPAGKNRPLETVGICLRGPQSEYGARRAGMALQAETILQDAVRGSGLRPLEIDTVLSPSNSAGAIHACFASSDIVLTTRMHGALLALAAGKPVIAIDQVPGGAKVTAVVGKTGWPFVFQAEKVSAETVRAALDELRTGNWRTQLLGAQARICALVEDALAASVDAIAH